MLDPKAQATLTALEDLFDAEYPINRERPADRGPAMGRYANDAYLRRQPLVSGDARRGRVLFQTGDCAAIRRTVARKRTRMRVFGNAWAAKTQRTAAFERGDMFMRTVQAYTPPSGDLSEQFDRATGAQTSAKHLAWSYAAFITAAASRRRAAQAIRG